MTAGDRPLTASSRPDPFGAASAARHWLRLVLRRSQPVGRAETRYLGVFAAALTSLGTRGVAALVGLITVPLTVRYLGAERYGLWVIVGSVVAWLALADLGVGHALTNLLARCHGEDRPEEARRHVASAFWLLLAVAAVAGLLAWTIWPLVDWASLLNVTSPRARAEASPAMAVAVAVFLLALPLSLVPKIYGAYQEGSTANLWTVAGSLLSLAGIVAVVELGLGVSWIIVAAAGAPVLAGGGSALWLFARRKPWLRPHPRAVDRASLAALSRGGGMFLVVQVAVMLIMHTDNVIVSLYLGAAAVAPYDVAWRLFQLTILPQAVVFPYLWPAYAEAFARGDHAWIRRTFAANLALAAGSTLILSLALVAAGPAVIRLWAGEAALPPPGLLGWMAAWSVLNATLSAVACLLNGSGRIRGQMVYGMATAAANIVLSVALVQRFGSPGVIAGTVFAFLAFNVGPCAFEGWTVMRALGRQGHRAV
jgi:O-antigen/teichoic acid export membrane protein